ncbi:ABC transporter permease subunit [Brucella intermedia]|uniref:ABC transporter permease subunit n=1 Tax=Brucella intermedia TaxID=94625 RepID=UPI00224912E2|nr:ABC transporter permease subunit [Brucella intermedia]
MLKDIWALFVDQGWALALLRGAAVTVCIGLAGMMLGLTVAIPLAVLRWRQMLVLSQFIDAYSIVVRSIPGLLVIYLMFFGSINWVRTVAEVFGYRQSIESIYPFIIGPIAIALISCAYSIEVIRGALEAIPKGLTEAAWALALPPHIAFFRITLPLALRLALGGINNVWQMTIKDTSLISVVGMQELMRVAAIAAGITRSPLLFYLIAAILFFTITGVSQMLFRRVEKSFNRGFTEG